jgi:hypothetical protein
MIPEASLAAETKLDTAISGGVVQCTEEGVANPLIRHPPLRID